LVRVLGVDPGTKSFDLVVVEGERVVWEYSVETSVVARDPESLVEAIREAGRVDLIAGPSGYGVPITFNEEIVDPLRFAVEVLLLSRWEKLKELVERGDVGALVYYSLARAVEWLWRNRLPTVYIPGVVHLPTVPRYRKVNRVDMGTADKMAVAVLATHMYTELFGGDYDSATFILVEAGYGYNAVIGVKNGVIVDGLGGTLASMGLLTIGPIDAEIAALGGKWGRSDVFHGGVFEACKTLSPDEAYNMYRKGVEPCASAYRAMVEGLARTVAGMASTSMRGVRHVLVSGRIAETVKRELEQLLPDLEFHLLPTLEGAKRSKHAAQGYAIVGSGLRKSPFRKLVEKMKIKDACGTALDHVLHPRLTEARQRLAKAYTESVKNPKLCK